MKITYNEQDDVLRIEFSSAPVIRDVSHGWNVHVGYSKVGLAEVTILDAQAAGYWPLEITTK